MKREHVANALLSPLWRTRGALPHSSAAQRCFFFRTDRWRAPSAADASKPKYGPRRAKRCARARPRSIIFRLLPRKQVKKVWFAAERWIYLLMLLTELGLGSLVLGLWPKTQDPRPKTQDPRPIHPSTDTNPI